MDEIELLTNSRAATFRRCRREHFFRYEMQRGPLRDEESLFIGRAFHDGVEAWRRQVGRLSEEMKAWATKQLTPLPGKPWGADPALVEFTVKETVELKEQSILSSAGAILQRPFLDAEVHGAPINAYTRVKVEEMFRGYHCRWFQDDIRFGYDAVEDEFSMPLVNPRTKRRSKLWRLSGKTDARQFRSGRLFLLETKSTSKPIDLDSMYFKKLELDSQVSTYYGAGQVMGLDYAGCIYDVARKPQISPHRETPEADRKYTQGKKCKLCVPAHEECPHCHGTGWIEAPRLYANQRDSDETVDDFRFRVRQAIAEAPDEYYRRALVPRRDDELEEHRKDLWMTARDIRDCKRLGTHPRNPDACERYNRFCPYWATCTGQADIFDNGVYRDVEKHPELGRGST